MKNLLNNLRCLYLRKFSRGVVTVPHLSVGILQTGKTYTEISADIHIDYLYLGNGKALPLDYRVVEPDRAETFEL